MQRPHKPMKLAISDATLWEPMQSIRIFINFNFSCQEKQKNLILESLNCYRSNAVLMYTFYAPPLLFPFNIEIFAMFCTKLININIVRWYVVGAFWRVRIVGEVFP